MKKFFNLILGMMLTAIAFLAGDIGSVAMAAGALADGGSQREGGGQTQETGDVSGAEKGLGGIATETTGRENGDPDFYLNDVDRKVVKIRPMSTPVDQISRYASSSHTDSFICKYYSVGTRPITSTIDGAVSAMTSGTSTAINVDDPSFFSVDDTIRVVGVKATAYRKEDGTIVAYDSTDKHTPDLMLCVCGLDSNGKLLVYAVNGTTINNQPIGVPALEDGQELVRMGKSAGETDAQTGRFESNPTPEYQYCQNFMMQVEQSFLDKIAAKEANWGFSDLEEDAIYDMRLTQEQSFLFGALGQIKHNSKQGMAQWFTKGIWWMPNKDITIGTYNASTGETTISDDNLIDMSRTIFTGSGCGNKKKVVLCGSEVLAAFGKIKSEKFRLVDSYENWHLKFTSWETGFGTLNLIHHELFDLNGMADKGFVLDPEYIKKRTHVDWSRNLLDLKKAGIRNTEAAVLQEISCIYLRYPNAHARLHLKKS